MYGLKKLGRNAPGSKVGVILISIFVVSIIPLIILLRSIFMNSTQRGFSESVRIPKKNNTDQKLVFSSELVALYIPKDSIDLSGSFVIESRLPDLFSYASDQEWSRPIVVDIQYRNEDGVPFPGITFSEPVSICFKLSPNRWKEFTQRPDDFQVQYFDDEQSPFRWIDLSMSYDPDAYELCTQTDHLSIYALAVKPLAVIPITGPTSSPTMTPTPTSTTTLNTPEDRIREREATPPPANTKPPTDPAPTKPRPDPPTKPPPTAPPPKPTSYPNP